MSLSDPIADMLTRIRNANRNKAATTMVKRSKVCEGIAAVLKNEGYIRDYDVIEDGHQGLIRITLKYGDRGEHIIHTIKRVSKPGCRVYAGVEDIPRPLAGMGIVVVSTSTGIFSDRQCREHRVGGEMLCSVE